MVLFLFQAFLVQTSWTQTPECAKALSTYKPLPDSAFLTASELNAIRLHIRKEDQTKGSPIAERPLRAHGWNLFQSLAHAAPDTCAEPLWRTWFTDQEALRAEGCPDRAPGSSNYFKIQSRTMIKDELLQQHRSTRGLLFSNVLFNREVCDSIKAKRILDPAKLKNWYISGVRDIPELHSKSVAIKTDWRVVRPVDPLKLGVWKKEFGFTKAPSGIKRQAVTLPEKDWPSCVHVTQTEASPAPTAPCGYPKGNPIFGQRYTVDDFYHIKIIDAEQLKHMRALVPTEQDLAVGDILILVGFHISTKEIPDWFWATYWWKPHIEQEPWEKDGRPSLLTNHRIWRNYAMDVTASLTYPSESDGDGKVMYNPYLEATFLQFGTASNCMACHMRAASCNDGTDRNRVNVGIDLVRYSEPVSYFEGKLRTDFLWSLEKLISKHLCASQ